MIKDTLPSLPYVEEQPAALNTYLAMKDRHLIFSYCGSLNYELMTSLLNVSDVKLKSLNMDLRKKRHIINILIECLQNVLFHGEEDASCSFKGKPCLIALGRKDAKYIVVAGNHLSPEKAVKFKEKLDAITPLNAERIHQLYLEQLEKAEISEKGGAGLGILRMLRESGKQVFYNFNTIDERHSFFSLQIQITA